MITDFYDQTFTLYARTEAKVNGKLSRTWAEVDSYDAAIFTPTTTRQVRWDKQDFVISKNLYCSTDVPINLGDRALYNSEEFDVVSKENTNAQNHHYLIGLVSR